MLKKRIKYESGAPVYHCIGRIVGGEMKLGGEEKEYFRRMIWRVAEFSGVEVITYCVMSNHVHLLIRVPVVKDLPDAEICRRLVKYYGRREPWVQLVCDNVRRGIRMDRLLRERLLARMGDVSQFMSTLKQRFSKWYNKKYKRFGTLWAERFKSVLIEDASEALRTVAMYIDLNPVRAGLVDDPKDYRFCGHAEAAVGNRQIRRETIELCEADTWQKASGEYRQIMIVYAGESNGPNKRALSQEQVKAVLKRGGKVELADLLRLRIRHLSDGLVFGSREFVEEVFEEFRDRFGKQRRSGARKLHDLGSGMASYASMRDLRKDAVG
ncbi:MAG: transposase [Limisphaerales bacterium]